MKGRRQLGWFRDPLIDDLVFEVVMVGDDWFVVPYAHQGDRNPNGTARVLTMSVWKRLEQI